MLQHRALAVPAEHTCCKYDCNHNLMLKVHMNPAVVQILPWLSFSVPGVLNLAVLTINTGVALYCYFCCMFFDPGR